MAVYPSNFRYESSAQTLAWDGVEGAVEYEIQDQIDGSVDWNETYLGPNTQCLFDRTSGTYNIKGRTKESSGGWDIWSPIEQIVV